MRNRTIAIKVAEVIDGGTKREFYRALREALDLSRRAANKAVTECIRLDTGLMTGGKAPKPKSFNIYQAINNEFPGVTMVASNIARAVDKKYRQERWEVANGRKSICNYRSFPWPLVHNGKNITWRLSDEGEFLTASMKLSDGKRWTVRLAGGSNNRDKIKGLRIAIASDSYGDSKIWTDKKHAAVIGVSVRLDDTENISTGETMTVSTARDSLLIAAKPRTIVPFVVTGDEVKKWIIQRDKTYQRLRQDRKSGSSRQALSKRLGSIASKWNQRMDHFTHVVSKRIVDHAVRRKCDTIKLDMTIKSFMPKFPYHDLATKIEYKCQNAGIHFLNATQAMKEPDVAKPHVYFKYNPADGRVKIGKTGRSDGGRHRANTDSSQELVILAIDCQPKSKLTAVEKRHQAMFADHRLKGEWFDGEPVIEHLRATGWFGNAGNLSEISQVLPVETVPSDRPTPGSSVSVPGLANIQERSQEADNSPRYTVLKPTAVEVANDFIDC